MIDLAQTAARVGVPASGPDGSIDRAWRTDPLREPVSDPVALVRLTGNLARAHRDPDRGQQGRPLVYGGHTLALAQAALPRLFGPEIIVVGWQSCDHPAPVFADDLLETSARVLAAVRGDRGIVAELEVITSRVGSLSDPGGSAESPVRVQNWCPYVILTSH
jgi:acyl dehydratase